MGLRSNRVLVACGCLRGCGVRWSGTTGSSVPKNGCHPPVDAADPDAAGAEHHDEGLRAAEDTAEISSEREIHSTSRTTKQLGGMALGSPTT